MRFENRNGIRAAIEIARFVRSRSHQLADFDRQISRKLSHTLTDFDRPNCVLNARYWKRRVQRNSMQALTLKSDCAVAELFYQASHSGNMTRTQSSGLMRALCESALSDEDRDAVNRLLHAIRRGWVRILD